ncbi:HYC_CC_PP family protein [Sphingobacterium sp. SG20118]|uniref:HYC_CC_PP family protein n=1 Tax=Sphingobacterium TaxID=28453 RepID=UPI0004F89114|nr:hypothetical protein KO02_03725 [Sphingobacterium sp. ML3W]
MKQLIVLFLILHYSLTATSATVYFHFCHGETQSISLSNDKTSHSECSLCKKNDTCHKTTSTEDNKCKNVSVDLKNVDDNHFSSDSTKIYPTFSPAILVLNWIIINQFYFENITNPKSVLPCSKPISESDIPPYLVNCNFRI